MPTRLPSVLVQYFWPDSLKHSLPCAPAQYKPECSNQFCNCTFDQRHFSLLWLISNRFLNVQRFFHRRIRQTEPLLQNTPRHPPFLSSGKTCLRVRLREKSSAP